MGRSVRGALRALGHTGPVTSPTFTLGRRYGTVSHLDLHRLSGSGLEDEDPALLDDYIGPDTIAFVEWPEVAAGELAERARFDVLLRHAGGDARDLEVAER